MKKPSTLLLLFLSTICTECVIQSEKFELPKPIALPASNVQSTSFVANWKRVAGAESYDIDLFFINPREGSTRRPFLGVSFDSLTNQKGTSLEVKNSELGEIEPLFKFFYRVRADFGNNKLSDWSNEIEVTTLSVSRPPQAYTPRERKPLYFIASWENLSKEGVSGYEIEVDLDPSMRNASRIDVRNPQTTKLMVYTSKFESTYYYRVRSRTEITNNLSDPSNIVAVQPVVTPNCKLSRIIIENNGSTTEQEFIYSTDNKLEKIYNRGSYVSISSPEFLNDYTSAYIGGNPGGSMDNTTWYLTYISSTGNLSAAILREGINNPSGTILQYRIFPTPSFNGLDRNAEVIIRDGNDAELIRWLYTLNSELNIKQWSERISGLITNNIVYNASNLSFTVDPIGRPLKIGPDNHNTTYKYDNNLNPAALLRNQLLAMFVYTYRAFPFVPSVNIADKNVGFRFFVPLSNIREEKITTNTNFAGKTFSDNTLTVSEVITPLPTTSNAIDTEIRSGALRVRYFTTGCPDK